MASTQPSSVDTDCPCAHCGYSLRGLAITTLCPECATPVSRSLAGDILAYSDPRYLRALRNGAGTILISLCVLVALLIFTVILVAVGLADSIVAPLLFLLDLGVFLVGWWLITRRERTYRLAREGSNARRLVRVAILMLPAIFGLFALASSRGTAMIILALACMVVSPLLGLFAGLRHVQWLASRIPDPELKRRAGGVSVFLGLIVTFGGFLLIAGGGLVIQWTLLVVLMFWLVLYARLFLALLQALNRLDPNS